MLYKEYNDTPLGALLYYFLLKYSLIDVERTIGYGISVITP